jgi:chaperonin GroEL
MAMQNMMRDQEARDAILRGVVKMTDVLRPTLGPAARTVAVARIGGGGSPEILDDSATIMQRTIDLEDPFESVGAMIIRDMVREVSNAVGDGAGTAAILARRTLQVASRYVAAGGNPMILKRGLEHGVRAVDGALRRQAQTIELPSELANIIRGSLRDEQLAEIVGEVLDSVGPDGAVLLEDSRTTSTTHHYIEGIRWNEGYVSPYLLSEGENDIRMVDVRVLVTNYELRHARQVLPILEACVRSGDKNLFIIAPSIRDSALSLIVANRRKGLINQVAAVKAPAMGRQRTETLQDLAVATGGRFVNKDAGEDVRNVTEADLGRARQVWVSRFNFAILGGAGDQTTIRARIKQLRDELSATAEHDTYSRDRLTERIGKLAGTTAIIRVGAPTKSEQSELRQRIQSAVASARSALKYGVVPGGGAAYIGCIPILETVQLDDDESIGIAILSEALTEPMRAIVENAGYQASTLLHDAANCHYGKTFDVRSGQWVDPTDSGILDPLQVTSTAVRKAISAAIMALTTEMLIRNRRWRGKP